MGFETIALLDNYATRENILKVLGDELPKKVETNDRVLIFFAGRRHFATSLLKEKID